MLLGILYHTRGLSLSDLAGKDAADPMTLLVHFQHDLRGFGFCFLEKLDQDMYDEIHGCVVVVYEEYSVERGFFDLRLLYGGCMLIFIVVFRHLDY